MNRKIQKTSTGTFFVTLPKEWVREHNIEIGAPIEIEIRKDGALVIYPPIKEGETALDKIYVTYSKGQFLALRNLIMGAYLLGYNIIEVVSRKGSIDPKDREEIRKLVHFYIGLEVIDEDETKMVIRSILDPTYTDPSKLLRRMAYLVEDMLRDGFKAILTGDSKLANLVTRRDEEVNRVYFLLIRLLRGALRNPALADRYMLSLIDYLDYRVAAKIIESIGDIAAQLDPYITTEIKDETIKSIFNDLINMYKLAIDTFFTKDEEKRMRLGKLEDDIYKKIKNIPEEGKKLNDLIRWLISESIDIADLAIMMPTIGV